MFDLVVDIFILKRNLTLMKPLGEKNKRAARN